MRVRDALGPLFTDEQFAELFAAPGRPAWSPARLALVLVLGVCRGPHRPAGRRRGASTAGLESALGLDLGALASMPRCSPSLRARLLADGQAERLLGLLLDRRRERGLLHGGGRQRTDATQVHMAVRDLHRLEQVIETLRAALEAWRWWRPPGWAGCSRPSGPAATASAATIGGCQGRAGPLERAIQVGQDGLVLLEAVYAHDAPAGLAGVEAVQVLRATWIQQFYLDDGRVRWRDQHSGLPPGSRMLLNPYDLDARPASNAAAPGAATGPPAPRPVSPTGPPGSPMWPPPPPPPPTWTPSKPATQTSPS
jgi:hypothetical protein